MYWPTDWDVSAAFNFEMFFCFFSTWFLWFTQVKTCKDSMPHQCDECFFGRNEKKQSKKPPPQKKHVHVLYMHTDGGSVFQKRNFKRSKDTAAQIDKISLWSLCNAKFLLVVLPTCTPGFFNQVCRNLSSLCSFDTDFFGYTVMERVQRDVRERIKLFFKSVYWAMLCRLSEPQSSSVKMCFILTFN